MTESEFLNASANAPEDDFLRLAFADWLDDRGDADRAEFIRLRVELFRQENRDWKQERRTKELLAANRERWLGPLAEIAAAYCWGFPRGLPEELHIYGGSCKGNGDTVVITLASSPHLRCLTTLRLINCQIGNAGAEALAASPHLTALQALDLSKNPIGTAGRRALLERWPDRVLLDSPSP
jgi:uncharacterized protein (TIGR02996 family)